MSVADRPPLRFEVIDEEMAAVLRTKTHAERYAIANRLWIFARDMLTSHLSSTHPEWSGEEVAREVAKRMAEQDWPDGFREPTLRDVLRDS